MKSLSIISLLLLSTSNAAAFQTPSPLSFVARQQGIIRRHPQSTSSLVPPPPSPSTTSTTQLSMSYQLPPGGGPPKGDGDDSVIRSILTGGLTIGAIVLFFVSPLGGIFFAITNSLLVLALITPVVGILAFQIWRSLNTINGACPSCGAPDQVVLKDSEQVSFCFNCGAFLTASGDKTTIELANNNPGGSNSGAGSDFIDQDGTAPGGSMFDQLFGGMGGGGNSQPEQPTKSAVKEKENTFKREQTVIDVEVSKDDQ